MRVLFWNMIGSTLKGVVTTPHFQQRSCDTTSLTMRDCDTSTLPSSPATFASPGVSYWSISSVYRQSFVVASLRLSSMSSLQKRSLHGPFSNTLRFPCCSMPRPHQRPLWLAQVRICLPPSHTWTAPERAVGSSHEVYTWLPFIQLN